MEINNDGDMHLTSANCALLNKIEVMCHEFEAGSGEIAQYYYPEQYKKGIEEVVQHTVDNDEPFDALIVIGYALDFNENMREIMVCYGNGMDIMTLFINMIKREPDMRDLMMDAIKCYDTNK